MRGWVHPLATRAWVAFQPTCRVCRHGMLTPPHAPLCVCTRFFFGVRVHCLQTIIKDICNKMGNGMADFAELHAVETKKQYELYSHYVAGLVGHGLSRLFSASELESPTVANELDRANSMGLFLQKTNIIRDYKEDLDEGRTWYVSLCARRRAP